MKLLLLTTFVATICCVNAGKTQRLLAAALLGGANGGVGLNGGLLGGVNGPLLAGLNGPMLAGMNGGLVNRGVPAIVVGGLNPPMAAAGGAAVLGQPQYAQFVPGLPAFALPAPVPNVYPVPAVNVLPFMGVPQMPAVNPPQQPLGGIAGGAVQQQPPVQPDPLRRFRRHIMKQDNTFKTTVDTQIPAPTETMTAPCDEGGPQENY